jgi:hypothetical protein
LKTRNTLARVSEAVPVEDDSANERLSFGQSASLSRT